MMLPFFPPFLSRFHTCYYIYTRARLRSPRNRTPNSFPSRVLRSFLSYRNVAAQAQDRTTSMMAAAAPSPVPAAIPAPTKVAAADEMEHEQMHVLAVDDNNVDRAVIAKILRSSKYRVTTVDSATRALELLGLGLLPDVNMIITDYWMPGMTGYELLKRVKESSELREIPVVIMSSENVPNRISRCLEEGAEDFLLKPVRPSDVYRLCSRIR